jgi:hypothetical protein
MCKQHSPSEEPQTKNFASCFDFALKKIQSEYFANLKNGQYDQLPNK